MNVILRLTITAVLAVPLALPTRAATFGSLSLSTPLAVHRAQLGQRAAGPREVFLKLHAQHRPQVAHFAFPFGLATDKFGNLFVTNVDSNAVVEVTAALKVLPSKISQQIDAPLSVALDSSDNVYVGNGNGTITQYSAKGVFLKSITTNAEYPFGIAVDQFQDLFILTPTGLAIDDASGAQIFGNIATGTFYSVTLGGPNVFAFYQSGFFVGNGSVALRAGGLQFAEIPSGSVAPVGSACAADRCWYDDNVNDLLVLENAGTVSEVPLPYKPAGMAYDPLHSRLFIADSVNNEIQVYDAKTLAFERSLT